MANMSHTTESLRKNQIIGYAKPAPPWDVSFNMSPQGLDLTSVSPFDLYSGQTLKITDLPLHERGKRMYTPVAICYFQSQTNYMKRLVSAALKRIGTNMIII